MSYRASLLRLRLRRRFVELVAAMFFIAGILFVGAISDRRSYAATAVERDALAVAAVERAVIALGGVRAVGQVTDATVTGTIQPAPGSYLAAGTFKWEDAPPEFRYTLQTATVAKVFASGHGRPAYINGGKVHSLMSHMALASRPFHLPALVLANWLANAGASVKLAGSTMPSGAPAVHVRISLDTDTVSSQVTPEDWYFDPATGLPLRVEYRLPDNRAPDDFTVETEDFSTFQPVAGIQVPHQFTIRRDGALQGVAAITSVVFNSGLSPLEFDLSEGAQQ